MKKVLPFDEWRTEGDMYDAISSSFENISTEFKSNKRKQKGHADRDNDGLQFWAIDLHAAYEELKKLQEEHQGTDTMIDARKTMEQTCTAFAN